MTSSDYWLWCWLIVWRAEISGLLCTDVQVVHWTNRGHCVHCTHSLWMIPPSCSIPNLQSSEQWHWEISTEVRNMSEQCGLGPHTVLGAHHPGQALSTQKTNRCVKHYGWNEWQEVHWGWMLRCRLWSWAWLSICWILFYTWDSFSSPKTWCCSLIPTW